MTSPSWPSGGLDPLLQALQETYLPTLQAYDIPGLLRDRRLGRAAIVSSFGAESVVLLHYVTRIVPDIDVLFIDTGKHFPETLAYRDAVAARLGLNLISVTPSETVLQAEDPYGALYNVDPNICCTIRKVFPLQDALDGYDSWISGRKRFQSHTRAAVPILERDGGKLKLNPLALWPPSALADYAASHDLPPHPLGAQGYPSIGCRPCTRPVRAGEDARAGRWAGAPDKTECGIHLGPDGGFARRRPGG